MEVRKVLALRGPNIWANFHVLEVWVDLGVWRDISSEMMPGFNERLTGWLPTMIEHRCSLGVRGGFFERLRRGTYLAHILEHVTLELQTLAGSDVGFGRARETSEDGVYKVAIEYEQEEVGREAVRLGRELLLAAIDGRDFSVADAVQQLRDLRHEYCLGPSTRSIVDAAKARQIPYRRLNHGSLVQFGYGVKQRRICAAETDRTGAIAEAIAQDKNLTRTLLRSIGVPVPAGQPVASAEEAWEVAEDIGLPVVVKPQFGNHGRGVATNLTTREQVQEAYANARREEETVMVERFIPGADYRLLVVGEKVVAAAKREPAQVVGDGQSTVRQLVNEVNRDPRRSDGHATVLSWIKLDPVALQVLGEQGLAPDSIPAAGQVVLIRRNANLSTGGTAIDVTDQLHPEIADRAVEAARVIGLDIAGVDVIATDISVPLEAQSGAVVEVNAGPGLRMHLEPSEGTPRPVGEAILNLLFPEGETGRIPIVAVTGVNGKTTTTRMIAHILTIAGRRVGLTCTDGIYFGGRRIDEGDCSGPQSARAVLLNPRVDAAVFETARGGILREGLAFDVCDIAVVTNIAEGDHLGLADIDTPEKLAKVKRTIVEAVSTKGSAVLNADDPLVADMASHCPGSVVFFSRRGDNPLLVARRGEGGRVVFIRDNAIVLAEGASEFPLMSLDRIPLTHGGKIGFQVENAMAATAATWALGTPAEAILTGLESFSAVMDKVPGRFNLLELRGATVIVDYGHNPSSLLAILDAIQQFPHPRRSVVYSAAGDRRDADMIRQGELLAQAFDRVILYEDQYTRGRAQGEIMGLFRTGLENGGRVRESFEFQGWQTAVNKALELVQPGDLLLIQADSIDETMSFLRGFLDLHVSGREIALAQALDPQDAAKQQK